MPNGLLVVCLDFFPLAFTYYRFQYILPEVCKYMIIFIVGYWKHELQVVRFKWSFIFLCRGGLVVITKWICLNTELEIQFGRWDDT